MATIKRIRSLHGVGILGDREARDPGPNFLHYNLIYGFNGSGKSTLGRLFASLEAGNQHDKLPKDCSFEIELDDGTVYSAPDSLSGIEKRICVFNTDFIERSLHWAEGRASSIFYISEEQAELASELRVAQSQIPVRAEARAAQEKVLNASDKAVKNYRTERARLISSALHLGNRRYEALQLQKDFLNLKYDSSSILTDEDLQARIDIAQKSEPLSAIASINIDVSGMEALVESTRGYADLSLGKVALDELEKHPSMVPWLKSGHEYHATHDLDVCLLCAGEFPKSRKAVLAAALDDGISKLLSDLQIVQKRAIAMRDIEAAIRASWPAASVLDVSVQAAYGPAKNALNDAYVAVCALIRESARIIAERLAKPTVLVVHALPEPAKVAGVFATLRGALAEVNNLVARHNDLIRDFEKRQEDARAEIKKHFLAEGSGEYKSLCDALAEAETTLSAIDAEIAALREKVSELSAKVRTHGPAADKITKLIHSYLGHGELKIYAASEGYELHRHGEIVTGPPSEGEKTAIAISYFLSTLEADGRAIKDLIVVVDDPISSLDTKAMNYACSLVLSRLSGTAQLFVLTHNQHCMNEFRKAWMKRAYPEDGRAATAGLFFLDVRMPEASTRRLSQIIEMPKHLRSYDSEYHFLCSKSLEFEAAGSGYSDSWFMMPNVIRRILEIFLAFKAPGTHSLKEKLMNLAKTLDGIDEVRVRALERLVQVESHSDSLDDLISISSMNVEETRDANAALLLLMARADPEHEKAIRRQCRPTAP